MLVNYDNLEFHRHVSNWQPFNSVNKRVVYETGQIDRNGKPVGVLRMHYPHPANALNWSRTEKEYKPKIGVIFRYAIID